MTAGVLVGVPWVGVKTPPESVWPETRGLDFCTSPRYTFGSALFIAGELTGKLAALVMTGSIVGLTGLESTAWLVPTWHALSSSAANNSQVRQP